MATFNKGESFKDQRVHVSAVFDQAGDSDSKNVMLSVSNDTREPDDVVTDPMLVYDSFTNKETGETNNKYTAGYTKTQWDRMNDASNKDGDAMVMNADLIPNSNGSGLVVNTETLRKPDEAFSKETHWANTLSKRKSQNQSKAKSQQPQRQRSSTTSSDESSGDVEDDVSNTELIIDDMEQTDTTIIVIPYTDKEIQKNIEISRGDGLRGLLRDNDGEGDMEQYFGYAEEVPVSELDDYEEFEEYNPESDLHRLGVNTAIMEEKKEAERLDYEENERQMNIDAMEDGLGF